MRRTTAGFGALGLALIFTVASADEDRFAAARARMVTEQIAARGIRDAQVLEAMRAVERHQFVPASERDEAYDDHPLPIGHRQTISQPYIVALMTELAQVGPRSRVLEIGTGSGYQAAVLAKLAKEVWSIEIVEPLARESAERLARLGYRNVTVRAGDGYRGWPEKAPFDAIVVTAGAPHVPPALVEQLKPGGRMVIPLGESSWDQNLVVVHKGKGPREFRTETIMPVRFVPLTRGQQNN
jgi:protein-L-isoaspartate(D-aspartate) O-methyltransferase